MYVTFSNSIISVEIKETAVIIASSYLPVDGNLRFVAFSIVDRSDCLEIPYSCLKIALFVHSMFVFRR